MNAPRRLTALPLPACLLRTIQRLTSSRFSPSGKSLPSSPLALTASRRIAPLTLLLIALLALGVVLLWSAPAEAQTAGTLVRNLSQGNDDSAALSGNDHAQLFHTAANTGSNTGGWVVTSVIVDSEDADGDDFDVDICLAHDTTGFPTSDCTDLQSRSDFTAGQLVFRAYFTGILLNANDNYTVVISQRGTGNVTLDSTTSGGEDSGSVAGWSIKDKFDWNNAGTWQQKSGANEALRIRIDGYERPGNRDATGRPRVLPTGEDQGILYADTSRIADADGFVNIGSVDSTGIHHEFDYQWIRVDGNNETNIADATSARYRRVEDDIGKHIKVEVSYTDRFGGAESVTSLEFGPVPAPAPSRPATTLVGNTGQSPASASSITSAYEIGFKLGNHGQGYEISSVSIDLAAAPASLTVSLYAGHGPGPTDTPGVRTKVFDFENPDSFTVGLNEFTAPAGAFAYQNADYYIRLSGFGTTLSINETTSDDEDAGGEPGASLANEAGGDTNVLRLAVKGSKRTSGIIASTYTQITGDQEIVSVGDLIGNEVFFGPEADRYLIRGLSFTMDDTTSRNGGFTNPWRLRSGNTTLFRMVSSRQVPGINEFTAPVGSTVAGRAGKYNLYVDIENFDRMGEVILTRYACTTSNETDAPSLPGVRFGEDLEDFACPTPVMAILGDPLYAMAQNLGQTDSSSHFASGGDSAVVSQGFTTGPSKTQLTGIGFNLNGSDGKLPDGPTDVSVAVHTTDADGKPDAKLFDLISPSEYAPASLSFFEAPAGTVLDPDTTYAVVRRYLGGTATSHRLQGTTSLAQDSGALAGFSIANAFFAGPGLSSLSPVIGPVLEIAVYTNRDLSPPKRVTGFDLVSNNSAPRGVWGNEETIWVANDGSGATDKLYAYNRSDRSRDSSSDFDTLNTPGNNNPRGICSDGTTMFVADGGDDKIYAYKMSDTTRDSGKDVTLDSANNSPQGLSCDRTHLWVAEDNDDLTSKIFVYLRSNGSHVSTLDIGASTLSPSSTVGAINNNDQRGMWSNGTTLFVVDHGDTKVYGYKLSDQTRDDDKNLDLVSANASPWGLWFDGRVLWVADTAADKLYVYDLPGAQPGNTPADGVPEVRTSQDVWSATLTVKDIGSNFLGCDTMEANKGCEPVELLTDNTFSYDSVNYRIDSIYLQGGQLSLETSRNITAVALAALTLHVGGLSLPFEDATQSSTRLAWTSTGLSWSVNDTVSLRITGEAPPADGDELRADTSGITDDTDGLANVYYHYQWIRVDGTTVTELDGETGPTYTATADDVTKDIQVRVIFDDDVRNREYPRYSPQVTVREVPPVVTGVTLTSNPGSDGIPDYAIGESVTATVTFDKVVDVTAGPQITLLVGTADKAADCAAATNTTTVECSYEVAANDTAPDGVGIKANTLTLNGGTIYSTGSTTNAATLTHLALALQSGHLVDGIRPTLVTTGNKSPRTSGDGDHIILTFSKNISAVDLAKINISAGNIPQATTAASATGTKVEIELTTPLTATSTTIIVELAVNAVKDAAGNGILAVGSTTVLNQVSAAPSAPTNLMAEPAPDETPQLAVDLSWTAPTSDGSSAITSHQYRYKVGSGSFGSWTTIANSAANGTNATSFTVTGLPTSAAPIVFMFEVRAINDNGNGAESDPATATIDKPDAITTLTPTIGNGQVEFTWSTPANNGSAILRYEYNVIDSESIIVVPTTNIAATATSLTITGLTNGDAYSLGIRAVNTVGRATWASYGFTPMAGPPGKPSVTVQSRVAALYVSWTLEDDGGSNITEYQVQWKSGAQTFDSTRQQAGLTATNTRIENLINGTEYDVRVRAMNSINWGPWSDIDSGTPVEGPAVSLSAETLSIDEGGSGAYSVVITTEPTAPVSILISPEGDVTTQPNALVFTASNWNIWQKVAVNAAQDGDADDDAVTIHHYTVTGTSAPEYAILTGLPTVRVTVLDDDVPPPAVRGFIAVDESQDAIALSWWSERGAAEYELEYRKQGDTGAWTRVTRGDFDHLPSTTGNRSLTGIATGLECETTYDFRIRLRGSGDILLNAFGPHTEVSRTTGECAQPNKPTNLMYTLAPDCATLTWTAPAEGDYTGVRIRRLTLGDPSFTVIHEDLNSRPTSYRDCTHTGDGYGDGDSPEYAYAITYIKRETRSFDNNAESKVHRSGLKQYGPAVQDHLHATPRNVLLTVDTDSQRRMTWEAPPSGSLTIERGLQGASVPVPDPWITGYVVERREFRARADGYLYFLEAEDTPIWSATMIAREGFRDGIVILGYRGGAFGSLSEDEFNHDSGRYQVLELSHGGGSQNTPPTLELTIDGVTPPHVAEDWVLVIDGTDFPLADALVQYPIAGRTLITWNTSAIVWTNLQQVSVQMVDRRDRYGWERLRRGRDGDTSTSFTDDEQANGRKFVYRIMTANTLGVSTNRAIFDWLFDSPYRDAVVDLAATDTTTDDGGAGDGETNTGNAGDGSANNAAAGAPTIDGTPQVGQTLTADTSAIDDADGLTSVSYEYQWMAGASDIDGATGSTYTLTASEQGKTVQVRVTFTDDADNEETLTSAATVAVAAAAPAPLTAGFQDLPDSHDGSTAFTFRVLFSEDVGISYVNMRDDAFSLSEGDVTGARRVDGRNDLWEITVEPDDNSDVVITLPANRSCTTTGAICTREDSPRQLTNSPTATVTGPAEAPPTNTSAAGAPTISGTPQVEQTLTADTSSITDEDGLTNVSYSYQWIAGGSDIAGATGSTYTLTASQQGKTIQVRVTFTDDADNEETLTSEATAEVTAAPAPLTASLADSRFQSARHKGADDRPQVIVAFSLPVASFEKTTPSLSLTGAAVSSVRQHEEDGLDNAWIFFLDPDGNDDIAFSLVTGQPCNSGGICTEDGEMLSGGVQVILPGPEEEEQEETGDDQQTPQSPPAKPTGLTATVNADGHIVLSWTAPNDDSITGYQVLRRLPSEGESALLVYVADTESTATTFTDTGVTAGVTHVYRVKAINAAGLSGWSNYVNPTP